MDFTTAIHRVNHIHWKATLKAKFDSKTQLDLGAEYLKRMAKFFQEQSLAPINPLLTNIAILLGDKESFDIADYCSLETQKFLENKSLQKTIVTSYLQLAKYSSQDKKINAYLYIYEPLIQLIEADVAFGFREGGLLFYEGGFIPLYNWYERWRDSKFMTYIYFEFEEQQFFMELDRENYAQRQLILYPDGKYEVSCRDDCLAEGKINLKDNKEITIISFALFESKWSEFTTFYRNQWKVIKENYPQGQCITGIIKYFYPQGPRLNIGTVQGIVSDSSENIPYFINCAVQGVVSGYDEQNMWLILENVVEIKIPDCLKSFISLLRCAFPYGIDEENYFLLLHLLYDDFCDEHLAKLMSLVMNKTEAVVNNDIAKTFSMVLDTNKLRALETLLNEHEFYKLKDNT